MIGEVRFTTHRGEPARAVLDDGGRWHCHELPVLNRVLNILHEPRAASAEGYGRAELEAVAAWLRGTVWRGAQGPGPPPHVSAPSNRTRSAARSLTI